LAASTAGAKIAQGVKRCIDKKLIIRFHDGKLAVAVEKLQLGYKKVPFPFAQEGDL
jgi:hypothetical protein